jgi:glycerol-3-phosphate acyltransferase PlsY
MTLVILTIAAIAYVLGSIPFGLIVARSQGIDIRQHGSGNIGATNVWRVLGKKYGIITFAADVLKGLAAVLVAKWLAARWGFPVEVRGKSTTDFLAQDYAGIAAALGCIFGHSFPVWLGFKGGKGVATSLGVIFGMMPSAALLAFALWGVVFKIWGYVSLASIVAAAALPIIVVALLFLGWLHGWGHFFFAVAAGLLVIRRHRENISRLVAGTEKGFKKPAPASSEPPPTSP